MGEADLMTLKLVFGILLTIGGDVLIVIAFTRYYRYLVQEKRCTDQTIGKVVRYSAGDMHLPKVKYQVNGQDYFVNGPEFRGYYEKEVVSPSIQESTVTSEIDNKLRLHVTKGRNPFAAVTPFGMQTLYPVGKEVNVFYDPNKPKLAFVERYCNLKWAFWLTFLAGCLILLIKYAIFIFL